jgi:hypothetical protein
MGRWLYRGREIELICQVGKLLTPLEVRAGGTSSLSVPSLIHITHSLYYLADIEIQVNYRSILNTLYKIKSEVDCTDSFSFTTFCYY